MDNHSPSSLIDQESETCLDTFIQVSNSRQPEDEEEYVETLSKRETQFGFKKNPSLVFREEVRLVRLEAIEWIFKTREAFGFRYKTAYLSMTYVDRFLSLKTINNNEHLWAIRLMAVASLRIAAKMEEPKIPNVSQFRFYEEGNSFQTIAIERMELLVLTTLEWKMKSITPFSFLHYCITRLTRETPPANILSRIIRLIMALIREINLVQHRPSAIAAAATLAVLEQKLTKPALESRMKSISHCNSLEVEDVFSCYNLMQELEINQEPSDLSSLPMDSRPNDVQETASVTNDGKRLASSSSDQSFSYGEKRLRN